MLDRTRAVLAQRAAESTTRLPCREERSLAESFSGGVGFPPSSRSQARERFPPSDEASAWTRRFRHVRISRHRETADESETFVSMSPSLMEREEHILVSASRGMQGRQR